MYPYYSTGYRNVPVSGKFTFAIIWIVIFPGALSCYSQNFKFSSISIEAFRKAGNLNVNDMVVQEKPEGKMLWVSASTGLYSYNGIALKKYSKENFPILSGNYISNLSVDISNKLVFSVLNSPFLFTIDEFDSVRIYSRKTDVMFIRADKLYDSTMNNNLVKKFNQTISKFHYITTLEKAIYYNQFHRKIYLYADSRQYLNNLIAKDKFISQIRFVEVGKFRINFFINRFITVEQNSKRICSGTLPENLFMEFPYYLVSCVIGDSLFVLGNHAIYLISVIKNKLVVKTLVEFNENILPVSIVNINQRLVYCRDNKFPEQISLNGFSLIAPESETTRGFSFDVGWQICGPEEGDVITNSFIYRNNKYSVFNFNSHSNVALPEGKDSFLLVTLNNGKNILQKYSTTTLKSRRIKWSGSDGISFCKIGESSLLITAKVIYSINNQKVVLSCANRFESNEMFTCIQLLNKNLLLAGTTKNLYYINPDKARITKVSGTESGIILFIYLDKKGRIWIGKNLNELFCKNGYGFKKVNASFLNLADDFYNMYQDSYGFTWFTTNRGLIRAATADLNLIADGVKQDVETIQLFDESNGLFSPEFNGGGVYPEYIVKANGELSYPNMAGVVQFHPGSFVSGLIEQPFTLQI